MKKKPIKQSNAGMRNDLVIVILAKRSINQNEYSPSSGEAQQIGGGEDNYTPTERSNNYQRLYDNNENLYLKGNIIPSDF